MPVGFLLRIGGPIVIAIGVFTWGYSSGSASKQRAWDLNKAEQVQAMLKASEQARATEAALQQRVNDANTALQTERAKHARIASGLKRDADKLRDEISEFARGRPEESAAACSERSSALGNVLDSVLSDYRACAESAESVASDMREVIKAWPN